MKGLHGEQIIPWQITGGVGITKISAGDLPQDRTHFRAVLLGAAATAYVYMDREFSSTAEATADATSSTPTWDMAMSNFGAGISLPLHFNEGTVALISIYAPGAAQGYLHFEQCRCDENAKIIRALDAIAGKRLL